MPYELDYHTGEIVEVDEGSEVYQTKAELISDLGNHRGLRTRLAFDNRKYNVGEMVYVFNKYDDGLDWVRIQGIIVYGSQVVYDVGFGDVYFTEENVSRSADDAAKKYEKFKKKHNL